MTSNNPGETAPIPTSIFNVELTTFEHVTDDLLQDVEALGFEPVVPASLISQLSPAEKRKKFEQWCTGRAPEDLEPLWERTADRAPERILEWAVLVYEREKALGHDIGLYSTAVSDDAVNALADGLESEFNFSVDVVAGRDMETDAEGLFTGQSEGLYKASFLETLAELEHRTYEFIADSFSSALPAVRKARRPLLVNPEGKLWGMRQAGLMDVVVTDKRDADRVSLQKANETQTTKYDLQNDEDREKFLEALYTEGTE